MLDPETNILLTGVPDEILRNRSRRIWIGDYKTAKCTGKQDLLAPMYQVQLNCYAVIAEKICLGSVHGLGLLFYEPITDLQNAERDFLIKDDSFFLEFVPQLKPVPLEPKIISPLLGRVRDICDNNDGPTTRPDCRDCSTLDGIIRETGTKWFTLEDQLIRSLRAQDHRKEPSKGY